MKIISHRANLNGANSLTENTPEAIDLAINKYGMDVEIDVWMVDGRFMLGHDFGLYHVDLDFFLNRAEKLWVHCKNLEALTALHIYTALNVFWHEEDTYTLTSKGFIWSFPGVEKNDRTVEVNFSGEIKDTYPFAVCTDQPLKFIQSMGLNEELLNRRVIEERSDRWRIGPKISLLDCVNKTGLIESADDNEQIEGEVLFGKHKGRSYGWVKRNDYGYFSWAYDKIPQFKRGAQKEQL